MINPLVAVSKDVFVITNAQSTWVQMAFYGGYATMALPAEIFIRRFSYKSGIIVGLALYAIGALLSIPAAAGANFNLFIIALYILTFGLAFLETTPPPSSVIRGWIFTDRSEMEIRPVIWSRIFLEWYSGKTYANTCWKSPSSAGGGLIQNLLTHKYIN